MSTGVAQTSDEPGLGRVLAFPPMGARIVSSLALLSFLIACSGSTSSTSSSGSMGTSSGGATGQRCQGTAWECYHFSEPSSCVAQRGCSWVSYPTNACESAQQPCSDFDGDEELCIQQAGCGYLQADGTLRRGDEGGVCSGELPPCYTLSSESECRSWTHCNWLLYQEKCEESRGYPSTCSSWSSAMPGSYSGTHPYRAKERCESIRGCTWKPGERLGGPTPPPGG